jgi:hypothetical protein
MLAGRRLACVAAGACRRAGRGKSEGRTDAEFMARGATEGRVSRLTVDSGFAFTTRPLFVFDWARVSMVAGICLVSLCVETSLQCACQNEKQPKMAEIHV